jgi:general secretion pathway protein E
MIPSLQHRLDALRLTGPERVVPAVDLILNDAIERRASDVHCEPTPAGLEIKFRIDGVIHPLATLPRELAPNFIARLKVMAELLTYRVDVPQEGHIKPEDSARFDDMRVSTFPTVHGEKAVVRIFQAAAELLELESLGMPADIQSRLDSHLRERSGAILLTGPSGSGKTTTIYACLRRLAHAGAGRHIVTIEDPVERWIDGVSQAQARPGTEFDFARGLRSLLRQDPDVIMVGEIRDPETASVATEAALTGHLVFSTLHAGSACGVIGRLLEMGIEPYVINSGVRGILNQRLLRRVCSVCRGTNGACTACAGAGYRGRLLIAELLTLDAAMRAAILAKSDTEALEAVAIQTGWRSIRAAANDAVAEGRTTAEEVMRVLGPRNE